MSKEKEKKYDELSADQIFGLDDCEVEELNIEQWNGKVYMRTFTGTERSKLQTKFKAVQMAGSGDLDAMILVFVLGVCDASGKRMFAEDTKTTAKLKLKRGVIIELVATEIMKFNGLSESQEQIEEHAKNS